MRKRVEQNGLVVQAVAGTNAVFFGFDLTDEARTGCLGFALYREDHTENEAYWIYGFKTFRSVEPNPSQKISYTTDKFPVQGMWWGDYSAKPAHQYTYKIVAVYGTPASPVLGDDRSATLDLATGDPATGTHGVYFNRGVAASQAYATKFGAPPAELTPEKRAAAMTWLSRGLQEALRAFITDDVTPQTVIRAAAYEFTEPTVLAAFAQAHAQGADVKVIYHDKPNDPESTANEQAIAAAGLDPALLIARHHPVIAHNKFIVRATRAADGTVTGERVWTGSTNMSQGGIFGHSNVGHAVRLPAVAAAYLAYWAELSGDPVAKPLKAWVSANSPFAAVTPDVPGVSTVFSPRGDLKPLNWYAAVFTDSRWTAHLTLPFGMDNKHFEPAIAAMAAGGPLRFVMLDEQDDHQDTWSRNPAIQVAVGAEGGPDIMSRWAKETLTGFNTYVDYLHTKILLAGVLSDTPLTISGSANWSEASTDANDENMLVIAGDQDVADVYFTEYMRIFDHFYARYWAKKLGADAADVHSFLAEDDSWQKPYWENGPKGMQRNFYARQVSGNTATS
jgi:phosphatidylserine/phosphatidylglycerophosphate/cardiolipin synthase-like enzyme